MPRILHFSILRGTDYASFVASLDFECSCAAGSGALCGRVQCQQLCFGVGCGGGDWVVQRDAGIAVEDHYAAAGDFDVRAVFPGDKCGDSDVLEQVCAGVFGDDVEGGVFRGTGAGCASSAVWFSGWTEEEACVARSRLVEEACLKDTVFLTIAS